ncbi:MAG: tRNA (cytidine(56)-2'-O)-methyltransferase [Nitrososphaeria archaeon]|nr:tRNA (cytidine(56)-2'-O)-methyltransferase [Nitrososphaeria archaeon]
MRRITVLRLFHRVGRDDRVTVHVALTARAFGASGVMISGDRDDGLIGSIRRVTEQWGGPFEVDFVEDWEGYIRDRKAAGDVLVHLTMYGVSLLDVLGELRNQLDQRDMVVVVGASKVPRVVYELADYNVAIGNQPHSEIAALAVFLDRLLEGRVFKVEFEGAMLKVIPDPRGKRVLRLRGGNLKSEAWDGDGRGRGLVV